MEQYQELTHYGILGQKWGIRRYQNPDGTLTPAGKKHYEYQNPDGSLTDKGKKEYMKGAKKGKIDYKKLSDADLNMINSRFARENQFKQNVENYRKSTFKYKAKEALISRIKGGKGNGGGGGGGKKGGGLGIGKLLAMPIKSAFEDAFKFDSSNNKDNGGSDGNDDAEWAKNWAKNGHRICDKYVDKASWPNVKRGKEHVEAHLFNVTSTSGGRMGTYDSGGSNAGAERKLRERRATHQKPYVSPAMKKERKREKLEERAAKSGLQIAWHSDTHYAIRRVNSDELMHFGIIGQKWGVRRFQNADGTWTEAGKERYGSDDDSGKSKKDLKREAKDMNSLMKGARKAFRPGNWSKSEKLSKSDKINKLADDKELIAKAKKATDLKNKLYAIANRNEEYERKLGVYGDDLDGWDEKIGKKEYGIDAKQFNQVMKNRSEFKTVKAEKKQAESEYRQATMAKSESFVKDYMSKSYAKVKDEGDSLARYSEYVNHLLNVNLNNRVSI